MSQFTEQQTQITDATILKECLAEKGYPTVEHTEQPQPLLDFQGKQTKYLDKNGDKAEIIIRRKYVPGMSNDIGFKKNTDGTFSAIISQYDKSHHNDSWMIDLKKKYAEKKIMKTAKKSGLTFVSKKVATDGSFKMQFVQA